MMDYAARKGDPIQHSYVELGGEVGMIAGAVGGAFLAVGAYEAGAAAAALVLGSVLTGGLLTVAVGIFAVAAAYRAVDKVVKAGQKVGEAVGKTQTNAHAGDIAEGAPTVFTGAGMPNQARITDKVSCHPGKRIASGSETVWVEKHRATRKGEKTECAGFIRDGEHTVLIGGASVTELPIGNEYSDGYNTFNSIHKAVSGVASWITVDPEALTLNGIGAAADLAAGSSNATVAAMGNATNQALSAYGMSNSIASGDAIGVINKGM